MVDFLNLHLQVVSLSVLGAVDVVRLRPTETSDTEEAKPLLEPGSRRSILVEN